MLQKLRAKHNFDKFQNYLGERSIFDMKRNTGTVHVLAVGHLYVMLVMIIVKKVINIKSQRLVSGNFSSGDG